MILVILDQETLSILGLAQEMMEATGLTMNAILLGSGEGINLSNYGVSKVYIINNSRLIDPAPLARFISSNFKEAKYIVMPDNKAYRSLSGYLSGLMNTPVVINPTDVKPPSFRVNALGNRAIEELETQPPVIIVAQATRFKPKQYAQGNVVTVTNVSIEPGSLTLINVEGKSTSNVRIEEADVIVTVGRGFRSKDDLRLAIELAEALGAQLGCSRPLAADLKWLSEDHWVGLSGHKVKPRLYIAVGVSGQPQHLAGMMESGIVVVINNDRNAPFFKYCDYGVVEDLYRFLPVLTRKIRERRR
ncbi:electron transfer flavoprotein subunit alpha/FixB family protein [Caldivirga maquilingensis]|uniref:Electron transfer flavoprotein alpha subunit n=1 Tax=Caldivirga maquilingensis (strain ATCC 700844 / DSM 13496 / JCM 10307 / IC-167) TaxID=397948 RepID=A8MBU1_CALMQ|nr:electron transfer flavoprotein subunit alpha/FixB family protein [Caldivirga maquilingensis]ABW01284.1 Electron transfer flavoprotein alpha subunit [Caldivirga maquilingensis IC-167]